MNKKSLQKNPTNQDQTFHPATTHRSFVVGDTQVLPLPLVGAEGAHGDPPDGVGGDELSHHLPLVSTEVQSHVLKRPFL